MKNYKSSRKLRVGLNWYPGVNWSTTTIYDVVNIFSMKKYKSSRKLRVGLNWYPGVNWSTTTIYDVVNIFSMKKYKSLRKLRVGVNRSNGGGRGGGGGGGGDPGWVSKRCLCIGFAFFPWGGGFSPMVGDNQLYKHKMIYG